MLAVAVMVPQSPLLPSGVPPARKSSAADKGQVSVARWSRRRSREATGSAIELRAGMALQLRGLKAAPNLNGAQGVCQRFSEEQGRWIIQLENGEEKAVKLDNLILVRKTSAPKTQPLAQLLEQLPSEELREAMLGFLALAKKLGGINMGPLQYMENFGLITARAQWGERLWEGIAAMAQKQAAVYNLTKTS